jgi:hypothetical protein
MNSRPNSCHRRSSRGCAHNAIVTCELSSKSNCLRACHGDADDDSHQHTHRQLVAWWRQLDERLEVLGRLLRQDRVLRVRRKIPRVGRAQTRSFNLRDQFLIEEVLSRVECLATQVHSVVQHRVVVFVDDLIWMEGDV